MMRKITNGEYVFHAHSCDESRRGQKMTPSELHDFAVKCLMEEYSQSRTEVYKLPDESGADFYFINSRDGKRTNVLVVCQDNLYNDVEEMGLDLSWLRNEYTSTGAWPRVTVAVPYCVGEGCRGGEPVICGGEICFFYRSTSVIESETNPELDEHLSDIGLIEKYYQAWRHLDSSIIEPYLDKDFHYSSDWVFDEMCCRREFMEYLRGKFYTIRHDMNDPELAIYRDRRNGKVALVMTQDDHTNMIEIKSSNGRITSAHMCLFKDGFEEFDPKDELYQVHGDHLDAIMDVGRLFKDYMQKMMGESIFWKSTRTRVCGDEKFDFKTSVKSLRYGDGPMSMLSLIAYDKNKDTNSFVTSYPLMDGYDIKVKVERVREWDNRIEATIECSLGSRHFAFFATDYYVNKDKYVPGNTITVNVAAIAMRAKEAQRSFSFEGDKAADWIARFGEVMNITADYDDNGNIKPVTFGLETLVSYIDIDSKAPDEAQFQSPVKDLSECSLLDVEFLRGEICIHRDGCGEEEEVFVPLYFRKDMLPGVKENDPICGCLWMTGCLSGLHEKDEFFPVTNSVGREIEEFEAFMRSVEWTKGFLNLMDVVDELPLLSVREGYVFDAFMRGDDRNRTFQGYCCRVERFSEYLPHKSEEDKALTEEQLKARKAATPYTDDMFIENVHPDFEVYDIPSAMEYINAPFTKEGILQAWLADNVHEFLPRAGKDRYDIKRIVTDRDALAEICDPDDDDKFCDNTSEKFLSAVAAIRSLDPDSFMPNITVDGDSGELQYHYWNNWQGLVKVKTCAVRYGEHIRFGLPDTTVVVEFRSPEEL